MTGKRKTTLTIFWLLEVEEEIQEEVPQITAGDIETLVLERIK